MRSVETVVTVRVRCDICTCEEPLEQRVEAPTVEKAEQALAQEVAQRVIDDLHQPITVGAEVPDGE